MYHCNTAIILYHCYNFIPLPLFDNHSQFALELLTERLAGRLIGLFAWRFEPTALVLLTRRLIVLFTGEKGYSSSD